MVPVNRPKIWSMIENEAEKLWLKSQQAATCSSRNEAEICAKSVGGEAGRNYRVGVESSLFSTIVSIHMVNIVLPPSMKARSRQDGVNNIIKPEVTKCITII
ncbi:hypothetical protein Leryth_002694 [Lithospermum erythrorhizon]|nr:hypothetical protein Leryth_002694 [Lithospermum erythrorhizon]